MEHPSLLKSDRDQMDTFSKMFELDWRGDKSTANKAEFLSMNPVYLDGDNIKAFGDLGDESILERTRKACAPYIEKTVARMTAYVK
jgi:hypothetical protein